MKFLIAVKAWIVKHVIATIAIGAAFVGLVTTAIVVPVAVSNNKKKNSQPAAGPTYTVTWKNADGTILEKDEKVKKGSTPSFDGATPTQAATAQYSYTFDGWEPALAAVNADVTYTAKFSSETRKYTVTWKNDNGDVLETDENVPYGSTPEYNGSTPTKESTNTQNFAWSTWDNAVAPVTGDVTYTATFNSSVRKYTVQFVNYNGTVLDSKDYEYESAVDTTGITPSRPDTTDTAYNWIGWDSEVEAVTEEKTYTAVYESTHLDLAFVTDHYEVRGVLSDDYEGPIHIPSTWKGVDVTRIQGSAFYGNKKITAVTFDEGISYIGTYAFYNTNITEVEIPASVETIDEGAFAACIKLDSLTLNEGLTIVRQYAFSACSFKEVELPATLSIAGSHAFGENTMLTRVVFNRSASLNDYSNTMFDESSSITEFVYPNYNSEQPNEYTSSYSTAYSIVSLKKDVNLDDKGEFEYVEPNTETNEVGKIFYTKNGETDKYLVGAYGDSGAKKILHTTGAKYIKKLGLYTSAYQLDEVYISADTTEIGEYAFDGQSKMTVLEFESGDNALSFGGNAFASCSNLTTVDMSARRVNTLYQYTFAYCSNLKSITLPDTITTLNNRVFINTGLESFHVPKSLTGIYSCVFYGVTTIKEFTVHAENTNFKAINKNLFSYDEKTLFLYAWGQTETSYSIPSGTEQIGMMCFQECALKTISLPSSINHLSEWSFFRLKNMTAITFDGTLEEFTNDVYKHSSWTNQMKLSGISGVTCSDDQVFEFTN